MSEPISFNCPNCGSPLMPAGMAKEVKCPFCNSTVIVPEELLGGDLDSHEELPPEFDLFSPKHVEWLVQNGADATVKVEVVKERKGMIYKNNPVFDIMISGDKATGGKFESVATINLPREQIPNHGTSLRVKYKKAADPMDDISDYAIEISGQFVYMVLDNPEDIF